MAIYFTSSQIPALKSFKFVKRAEILSIALSKLTVPEKLLLNITKLAILSLCFIFIARLDGWQMAVPSLALFILYPCLTHPLAFYMANKHINQAILIYDREQAQAEQDKEDDEEDNQESEEDELDTEQDQTTKK